MYVPSKLGNLILLTWNDRVRKSTEVTIALDDTYERGFCNWVPKDSPKNSRRSKTNKL